MKPQVFDIPEPRIEVTQHQVEVKQYPNVNRRYKEVFPKKSKHQCNKESGLKQYQPIFNISILFPKIDYSEALEDLYGCRMSTGTISNTSKYLGQKLSEVVEKLAASVKASGRNRISHFGQDAMVTCGLNRKGNLVEVSG